MMQKLIYKFLIVIDNFSKAVSFYWISLTSMTTLLGRIGKFYIFSKGKTNILQNLSILRLQITVYVSQIYSEVRSMEFVLKFTKKIDPTFDKIDNDFRFGGNVSLIKCLFLEYFSFFILGETILRLFLFWTLTHTKKLKNW